MLSPDGTEGLAIVGASLGCTSKGVTMPTWQIRISSGKPRPGPYSRNREWLEESGVSELPSMATET